MQYKHATRRTATKLKIFVPYQNNFLGNPAAKGIPNQKKENNLH